MTKIKAHQILDEVRAGIRYPAHVVNRALMATGDLR